MNIEQIDDYLYSFGNIDEILKLYNISYEELNDFVLQKKNKTIEEYNNYLKAKAKLDLKRKVMKMAMSGNAKFLELLYKTTLQEKQYKQQEIDFSNYEDLFR